MNASFVALINFGGNAQKARPVLGVSLSMIKVIMSTLIVWKLKYHRNDFDHQEVHYIYMFIKCYVFIICYS